MIESFPLPSTDDPADAPFWQAALRGELVVQQCGGCARRRFPPRPVCPHCHSFESAWLPVSGFGRIWSHVTPHPPLLPAFAALAPYNVILVELEDDPGIRLVGNLVPVGGGALNAVDPHTIEIGRRVRVVFDRVADDVALPRWTPADD